MRADAPIFVPSFLKEPLNVVVQSNEKKIQRKGRKKNKDCPFQSDEFHKGNVNPDSRLITRRKQNSTNNKGRRNGKKRGGTDNDAIDAKDSIAFENMFPSLIKENFDTTRRGKPIKSGSNWSRVALDGQIKSEQAKAVKLREKLRLQHELETFTRLEVLKSSQHVVTSVADSNDLFEKNKKAEQNVPYVRTMNMEKLRQRWMIAYEEKRKKDEECALENKRQELLDGSKCQQESVLIDSTDNHGSDIEFVESDAVIDNSDSSSGLGSEMKNIEKYLECPFPLHAAVLNHDESAIVNLLSLPSDVTLRDTAIPISSLLSLRNVVLPTPFSRLGKTCSLVQLAVMLHRPNVLRLLLSKAVNRSEENSSFAQQLENLDDFHRTPLMFACEFALDGCINILLSFGAKVSTKHRTSGNTPLHIACHKGSIYSAAMLLKSICSRVESSSANKKVESARLKLLSNRNFLGETPMHIICKTNNVAILDSIAEMCNSSSIGKLLDIEDENGNTPLMLAIVSGAEDIVMNLIHRHHVHKFHSCPLIAAVESKSLDMVRILIECRSILALTDIDCDGALCSALSSFQGQGEDLEIICKILIAEGANPHAKTVFHDAATERSHSESALTIAALQGDEDIVTILLTCYDTYLVQKMKSLQVDPVLLNQSKSYFQAIEDKDKIEVQTSMRDCIVRIIMSEAHSSDDDFKHRLKCCVRIFRRNLTLDNTSFARILNSLGAITSKNCAVWENQLVDECIFRASYDLVSKEPPFHVKKKSSLYDDQSPDHYCSNLLFQLNWIIEEWRNMSLSCPWIQKKLFKVDESNAFDDRDLCILVVEGMHYKAHKSILKHRSGKFSAAISFHEMRHKIDCHHNDDLFMISLDISKESLRFLIEHIYHGSIVSELSCHSNACWGQLFDLYFVAQEYMCPTLAQEIEMRLLSSDPYFCSCWNCCMFNETSTNDEYQCFYQVKVCFFSVYTRMLPWYQTHLLIHFNLAHRAHPSFYLLITF